MARLTGLSCSLRLHGRFYPGPGLKFRRAKVYHIFFKMASANASKLFHQFGLVATLLLQHGLLHVYITYQHHVNKVFISYYAVKRTIAQKFNTRVAEPTRQKAIT